VHGGGVVTALQTYERLVGAYGDDRTAPVSWSTLAVDLRAEASRYSDQRAQERLDRAEECERRARKAVRP
jgi:hypothetical protein